MKIILTIACFVIMPGITGSAMAEPKDLMILGWVENAVLSDPGMELKAKLDTGAETSSLDARIVKKFRKSGKRWVRFAVYDRENGEETVFVRERIRTVGIVQHDGTRQTRPVVIVSICVAGQTLDTEVSLIDRSEFNYQLLLGRNALASFALVDPGNTFLAPDDCSTAGEGHGAVEPRAGNGDSS